MSQEPKIPVTFSVTPKAADAARAAADPNLVAPKNANLTVSKKDGTEYRRWVENGSVEFAYREASGDGKMVVYVVGVKFRSGEPNQNKIGWFRMRVHPAIASGQSVDADTEAKYGWIHEKGLGAVLTLIDVTGYTPKSGAGIGGALLESLFPLKAQKNKGPLIGKKVGVKIQQRPNTGDGATRDKQEDAELFLPATPESSDLPI